jgi:hypothetical protein
MLANCAGGTLALYLEGSRVGRAVAGHPMIVARRKSPGAPNILWSWWL